MSYSDKVLATAATRDEARALARTLPRPSSVRQTDGGEWIVVQLLPAKWSPAQVTRVTA